MNLYAHTLTNDIKPKIFYDTSYDKTKLGHFHIKDENLLSNDLIGS